MEYILAILFSCNRILYGILDIDLFYIFAAFLFIFYILRRPKASKEILSLATVTVVFMLISGLIAKPAGLAGIAISMMLNLTLLVYIIRDRYKWSMLRWCLAMSAINGVLTVVALFFRDSALWEVKIYDDMAPSKLRLFYYEPAMLCFVSGLLFIYFVYKLVSEGFSLEILVCSIVCLADMYYSFSFGGIMTGGVAIFVLLGVNLYKCRNRDKKRYKKTIYWTAFVVMAGVLAVIFMAVSPIYSARFANIVNGTDESLNYTVIQPVREAIISLRQSSWRGLGIGRVPDMMNSYFRVIAEMGIIGIIVVACIIVGLGYYFIRYGGPLDAALLTYIVLFQFTAGQFTNPVNWFVYGWILADCYGWKERLASKEANQGVEINDTPVTVGIIGAKGLANYGGYETFVDKLTEYHQNNEKINYVVACKANGQGCMDETKLEGAEIIDDHKFIYHNAYCFKVRVPQIGSGQAIIYDLLSAIYVINYFKRHRVEKPILYILTCRIGPFIRWIAGNMHDIGGVYYLNPDGHEFLRAYWSKEVRAYWKFSEKLMVKYADKVICDSKNIETYIKASYEQYEPDTTYIPYGSDLTESDLADNSESYVNWIDKHNISPKGYYLIVGRFVPENNYETMIREFVKSDTDKDLVIVTNVDTNPGLYEELNEKIGFKDDSRVKFVGTVYDQQLLKKIREKAYAYLHGHEVGGTNPSLIEALGSTKLNLLLNVGFNRECGEEGALYWDKDEDSLCELIEAADRMTVEEISALHETAIKRVKKAYSWTGVAEKYEKVFWKARLDEKQRKNS